MSFILISLVALMASLLTFYSGFGLGTLLTPVFAIFFPVELAVGMTAIVHLLNNLFKLILLGEHVNRQIAIRFGLPAWIAAFLGAWALVQLSTLSPIYSYELFTREFAITPVKLTIAVLLGFFTLFEILPQLKHLSFPSRWLILGGLLSGFFGGLSGHQGALRSAFLVRTHLNKESFLATGVLIACLTDIARLGVYSNQLENLSFYQENILLLATATGAAMAGALIGNRLLKKMTFKHIQGIVSLGLFALAIALGAGWI